MILKSFRIPTDAQSFPLPVPSPGYRVSGKEVEVCDSGSRHHQLCGCCNLQLIQSHVAPSHGPPARVLSPLFFLAKSLLLPKPRGKKKHSKTSWSSLLSFRTVWSFSPFQNCVVLFLSPQNLVVLSSFTSEPHGPLSIYLLQNLVVPPFTSELRGLPLPSEPHGLLFSPPKPCGPPYSPWLPGLDLNPSAHLPLQPHF